MRRWTIAGLAVLAAVGGAGGYAYVFERPWLIDRLHGPEARTELVPRPCDFTTESGRKMVCYDLYVPESRDRAGGRRLRLPVLVFQAPETPKKDDPVLLIAGGPGAIAYTERRFADMWKGKFKDLPWLDGRDLVVYDQRGVGGMRRRLRARGGAQGLTTAEVERRRAPDAAAYDRHDHDERGRHVLVGRRAPPIVGRQGEAQPAEHHRGRGDGGQAPARADAGGAEGALRAHPASRGARQLPGRRGGKPCPRRPASCRRRCPGRSSCCPRRKKARTPISSPCATASDSHAPM